MNKCCAKTRALRRLHPPANRPSTNLALTSLDAQREACEAYIRSVDRSVKARMSSLTER
jgi:hypothetical protein